MKLEELKIYFSISITLALRDYKVIARKKWYFNENWKTLSYGFTLAEVLITLTVIGVLAAITVPNMIASHQKTTWVTGLKKAYVVGNQVLQKAAIEECGTMDLACIFDGKTRLEAGETLAKYYNITQNCKTTSLGELSDNGCWAAYNERIDGTSSLNTDWDNSIYYKFMTADGMSIMIENYSMDGSSKNYGISADSPTAKACGVMYIDVNGKKGPNRYGRDVFRFYITSNKMPLLYPSGGKEDNFNLIGGANSTTGGGYWWKYSSGNGDRCNMPGGAGSYCTGRIMENGWKMDY